MGIIYLQNWNNYNEIISIEAEGNYEFVNLKEDKSVKYKLQGFGIIYKKDKYAIYVNNGHIYFRANDKEWLFDSNNMNFFYKRIFIFEIIKIINKGKTEYSRFYNIYKIILETLKDPTFDKIDELDTYFLQTCSNILSTKERMESAIDYCSRGFIK